MIERPLNILFLCTGNSARSILAEALVNHLGGERFRAYSAGSHPAGRINPFALDLLEDKRIATEGLRSKSWDEFAQPDTPTMDIVITVCGQAAGEACPMWPGAPMRAHWGLEDPAAVLGDDATKRAAFQDAFSVLEKRVAALAALDLRNTSRTTVEGQLQQIGSVL